MTNVVFVVLSFEVVPGELVAVVFASGVVELVIRIEVEVLGVVVKQNFCVVSVAAFVDVVVAVVVVVVVVGIASTTGYVRMSLSVFSLSRGGKGKEKDKKTMRRSISMFLFNFLNWIVCLITLLKF